MYVYTFVYDSNKINNCFLVIHALSRVCTIVLQLFARTTDKSKCCFLIIASKIYIPKLHTLALQRHGKS